METDLEPQNEVADVPVPRPGQQAGRYEFFSEIGSGGMASVHVARLLGSDHFARTVAVKRPLPALARDEAFRRAAGNEARLASRVHHPHVVATLDVVEHGIELLIVMEYIHGTSLAALMNSARALGERVPVDIGMAVMAGALRGLHAVHCARDEKGRPLGLVHCDVSPQNILCGVDGLARVGDFGLSRAIGEVSERAVFKGKLTYASPEQVELQSLTPASDIYSAGTILWELLVGERFHAGLTPTQIVGKLLTGGVPRPIELVPDLSPSLDAIVERALRRDPAERFGSALEMAAAIEAAVSLASPERVSAWVRELGAEALSDLEHRVMDAERRTTASRRSADLEVEDESAGGHELTAERPRALVRASEARPTRRRAPAGLGLRIAALLAGAALALAGVNFFFPKRSSEPASPSRIAGAGSRTDVTAPVAPPERARAPLVQAASPEAPPLASALGPEAPARAPKKPALGASARGDCSPPFSIGLDGIRRMKPGCQ